MDTQQKSKAMPKVYGSPLKIDWTDEQQVIQYAKKLGPGMVVFKHPESQNLNITHHDRFLTDGAYHACAVIHLT